MELSRNAQHYFTTALWSSADSNDEPLDANYDYTDLSEEAIAQAKADIDKFIELAGPLLDDHEYSQIMHDFWLTRNRHGAGFWDGDYDKAVGEALTKLSHSFSELNLYVGDDGKLYF